MPSPERNKYALLAPGSVRRGEGGPRPRDGACHARHRDHGLRKDYQPEGVAQPGDRRRGVGDRRGLPRDGPAHPGAADHGRQAVVQCRQDEARALDGVRRPIGSLDFPLQSTSYYSSEIGAGGGTDRTRQAN